MVSHLFYFLVIDLIWLGLIAKNLYQNQIGTLLKTNTNWTAAIIFYLLFIGGLVFFAIQPSITSATLWKAMLYGALFGFMTYATYDLTNLATLEGWPIQITIIDLIWGSFFRSFCIKFNLCVIPYYILGVSYD